MSTDIMSTASVKPSPVHATSFNAGIEEAYIPQRVLTQWQLQMIAGLFLSYSYRQVVEWLHTHDDKIANSQHEYNEAIAFMNECCQYFTTINGKRPSVIPQEVNEMIKAWMRPPLNIIQKRNLATGVLTFGRNEWMRRAEQALEENAVDLHVYLSSCEFVERIAPHFKQRGGAIPKAVVNIINE